MKVLGVVPARSGSKGVPNKNLRAVRGKPLLAYVLEAARHASRLDWLVVSTDCPMIAQTSHVYGAEVPFMRPPELAADHVSLIPVLQHAMASCDGIGRRADVLVSIQPTSPLLEPTDIDRAIQLLEKTGCDSVVAVTQIVHHHPFRAMKLDGDRLSPLTEYTTERYLQKQDRPAAYGFTGGLYVRRRHLVEHWSGRDFALGSDVRAIEIAHERAVNIDTELDLIVFDALLQQETTSCANLQGSS